MLSVYLKPIIHILKEAKLTGMQVRAYNGDVWRVMLIQDTF